MSLAGSGASDDVINYMPLSTPRSSGRPGGEGAGPPETIGSCDVRELLFTVSFVAAVTQMGQNLSGDSTTAAEDDSAFNNGDFMIFFLGVFVFWADTTQLRNR